MNRVYYFSRTGDSKALAAQVAEQTGGEIFEVKDNKNWRGLFGFVKGGYYATRRKKTQAVYESYGQGDVLYLCCPVWAGTFPPAVRTFVEDAGREQITLIATSMGGGLKDREGFKRVIDVLAKDKTVTV